MKKIVLISFMLVLSFVKMNAQNFELSTIRIGAFKFQMTLKEVKTTTEKPLRTVKGIYGEECQSAIYKGEEIKLSGIGMYEGAKEDELKVYNLSTKSPKFRTKSGMGIGSTKEQLLEAYKNYPNFSVGQRWDEKTEKLSTTETYFDLEDMEAGTHLNFILKNNVVVEVQIYMEEGC